MKMMNFLSIILGIIGLLILYSCSASDSSDSIPDFKLTEIAHSSYQWTGVAVSKSGRIFINYPRWSPEIPYSVGEIISAGNIQVYPDSQVNQWTDDADPAKRFICVQSVYVDQNDHLWVVDAGNPYFRGVISAGAKLVEIDLSTNQIIRSFIFDSTVVYPNSYLNDVRVDNLKQTAYLTDSGAGGILTVNLGNGEIRRLLDQHPSTLAEDVSIIIEEKALPLKVHADGIALDRENGFLYYQALTGKTMYRINTADLRNKRLTDKELAARVETVGNSGVNDGLLFKDGYVYLSNVETNSIKRISPQGKVQLVVKDYRLQWPDSFADSPEGIIYLTTSRIGFRPGTQPYALFKLSQ